MPIAVAAAVGVCISYCPFPLQAVLVAGNSAVICKLQQERGGTTAVAGRVAGLMMTMPLLYPACVV